MNTTIAVSVESKTIRELLNEMATIMPSEVDTSNYCYLPFWFQVTNDKVLAWHINQLPTELKVQIKSHRKVLKSKINKLQ